jgi:hypothetical protein
MEKEYEGIHHEVMTVANSQDIQTSGVRTGEDIPWRKGGREERL